MRSCTLRRLTENTTHTAVGFLILVAVLACIWAVMNAIGALVVWGAPFIGGDPSQWAFTSNYLIGFIFIFFCAVFSIPVILLLQIMKAIGADIVSRLKQGK